MPSRVFSETDRLYFMHIPKTAGASLTYILKSYFAEGEFYTAAEYSDLADIPPDRFRHIRGFTGHLNYNFHWLFDEHLRMITFLRYPVERLLSHVAFMHFHKEHPLYSKARSLSLLQILQDDELRAGLDNTQTRLLAIDVNPVPLLEQARVQRQTGYTVESAMWEQYPSMSDDETVALAKAHLDQFDFVGLTERFAESTYLLCRMFGWGPPARFPALNVGGGKFSEDEITEEVRRLIQELVQMDIRVYEYAQEIFERQLQENPVDILELNDYLVEQLMLATRDQDQLYAQLPGWAWTGVWGVRSGVMELWHGTRRRWHGIKRRWSALRGVRGTTGGHPL